MRNVTVIIAAGLGPGPGSSQVALISDGHHDKDSDAGRGDSDDGDSVMHWPHDSGPARRAAGTRRDIAIAYIEGIVVYSSAARDYILAAVPSESGAAQEARYPAGTLGARRYSSCHL